MSDHEINLVPNADTTPFRISDNMPIGSDNSIRISKPKEEIRRRIIRHKTSDKPRFFETQKSNDPKPRLTVPTDGIDLLMNPKKKMSSVSSMSGGESEISEDASISDESFQENTPHMNPNNMMRGHERLDGGSEESGSYEGSEESGSVQSGEASEYTDDGSEDSRGSRRERPKTFEEIQQEKQELLYRIEKLSKNGYRPSKHYTMQSDYEEIRYEYDKLKKQREIDKSIKFARKALMMFSSGVEFLNRKFDPFDLKLDGWSESVMENLGDYDEVFEELHEKYGEKVDMSPEIKLLFMIGGSAFMYHLQNTLLKSSMPSMGDIFKQNPDLMKNFSQAAMSEMRGKDPMMDMAMDNSGRKEMKGPSGVDDILNSLNQVSSDESEDDMPVHKMQKKPSIVKTGTGVSLNLT